MATTSHCVGQVRIQIASTTSPKSKMSGASQVLLVNSVPYIYIIPFFHVCYFSFPDFFNFWSVAKVKLFNFDF